MTSASECIDTFTQNPQAYLPLTPHVTHTRTRVHIHTTSVQNINKEEQGGEKRRNADELLHALNLAKVGGGYLQDIFLKSMVVPPKVYYKEELR